MKNIVFLIFALFAFPLFAHNSFAAVGETYDQMVQQYGKPKEVRSNQLPGYPVTARYLKYRVKIYAFYIDKFKFYALFNSNRICFKMFTLNNRTLPDISLLVGKIASTPPVEQLRVSEWEVHRLYEHMENAVSYHSWGYPGELNAEAIARPLEPK